MPDPHFRHVGMVGCAFTIGLDGSSLTLSRLAPWIKPDSCDPIRVNIRPTRIRKLSDQPIFEAFSQGIQPYVLDGDALLAGWAELAPPLGLSYMNPVGRPVTGAREAVLFDKGFQHKRAVTIAMQPVIW